jgi:hypothetical protein
MHLQIQLSSTLIASTWGRTAGGAASGDWEKYHRAGECMCTAKTL